MDLEPVVASCKSKLANGMLLSFPSLTWSFQMGSFLLEENLKYKTSSHHLEWFQFDKDFTEYTNLEECISYLCDYITSKGPFDSLLGFSQGATLAGLLIGYQAQGKLLKDHPPFKFMISISGTKFRDPSISDIAYKHKMKAKSLHLIGDKDWLKLPSEELASEFHNPLIIRHPQGHTVPRLDEAAVEQIRDWINAIVQSNITTTTATTTSVADCNDELENGEAKEERNGTDPVASSVMCNVQKESDLREAELVVQP